MDVMSAPAADLMSQAMPIVLCISYLLMALALGASFLLRTPKSSQQGPSSANAAKHDAAGCAVQKRDVPASSAELVTCSTMSSSWDSRASTETNTPVNGDKITAFQSVHCLSMAKPKPTLEQSQHSIASQHSQPEGGVQSEEAGSLFSPVLQAAEHLKDQLQGSHGELHMPNSSPGQRLRKVLCITAREAEQQQQHLQHMLSQEYDGHSYQVTVMGYSQAMNFLGGSQVAADVVLLDDTCRTSTHTLRQTLQAVRGMWSKIQLPVITLMPAHTHETELGAILRAGANDYLTAPYTCSELRARLGMQMAFRRAATAYDDQAASRTLSPASSIAENVDFDVASVVSASSLYHSSQAPNWVQPAANKNWVLMHSEESVGPRRGVYRPKTGCGNQVYGHGRYLTSKGVTNGPACLSDGLPVSPFEARRGKFTPAGAQVPCWRRHALRNSNSNSTETVSEPFQRPSAPGGSTHTTPRAAAPDWVRNANKSPAAKSAPLFKVPHSAAVSRTSSFAVPMLGGSGLSQHRLLHNNSEVDPTAAHMVLSTVESVGQS